MLLALLGSVLANSGNDNSNKVKIQEVTLKDIKQDENSRGWRYYFKVICSVISKTNKNTYLYFLLYIYPTWKFGVYIRREFLDIK